MSHGAELQITPVGCALVCLAIGALALLISFSLSSHQHHLAESCKAACGAAGVSMMTSTSCHCVKVP